MQSINTMYRVVVMGATLVIVIMGWRLYGPSGSQVKSTALRGIEYVEGWLRAPSTSGEAAAPSPAVSTVPTADIAVPVGAASPPPLFGEDKAGEKANGQAVGHFSDHSLNAPSVSGSTTKSPPASAEAKGEERLKMLLAELAKLDVQEPQLAPWGTGGQLYRFCCRATWGGSTQFSRHFESVAAEPETAVEQVLAQVDAWRTSERVMK
jgi:hypothetical protein